MGVVRIHADTGNSTDVEVLVVHEKPLNFDLLLGYDAIKALGGTVKFQKEALMCAALKIDQPDFSAEFNQYQKTWIASWKCTGNRESAMLQNQIAEYHVLDYIRPAYKKELIMDYWMVSQYVNTFMADADVCTSKLCEWLQHGSNVSLLDLRKAYLQV